MSGASRLATDAPLTPLAPPPTDAIDVDSETDLPPRRQAATRPVDSTSTTASDDVRTPLSPAFGFISALADMPSAALRFASPAAMNPPAWPGREEEASTSASASASKARSESLAESPESVTATRQRPRPLELDGSVVDLSDPPLQTPASTVSTSSVHSNMSSELMDLSKLRRSIQQNLRERPLPVDEDLNLEDASESVASSLYDNSRAITVQDALALFRVSQQYLVVDTRVLEEYSTGHVQRSVNVSIPSLLLHRLRKQTTRSGIAGWVSLTRYIGTAAGQALWDSIDLSRPLDLVIVGADADDIEGPFILADILEPLVTSGRVRVLAGGWTALAAQVQAPGLVLSENINQNLIVTRAAASPDRAVPTLNTMLVESPIAAPAPSQTNVPAISSPAVMHPPRFPSLTTTDLNTPRRPPKLQLNMTRSAPAIAIGAVATPQRSVRPKLGGLTIDVGPSRAPAGPHSAFPYPGSATPRAPGGLTVNTAMAKTSSLAPPPGEPWTEASATPIGPAHEFNNLPPPTPIGPGGSSIPEPSPLMRTTTDISTILPSFLFLGPEIATQADVDELLALGVRRILNVAIECDDDEGLGLRTAFEKYYRIPMKDSVDESGVSKGIRDACKILDDARLHSAPTYVHCKAGRSRSVTVVLAYLIHANAWTLHTSYQYVAERRHGISPNIGFVAELMEFETSELGHKQGQQYSSDVDADAENDPPLVRREPRVGPRYTRESLPPEFGSERLGGLSLGFGQLPDDSDSDGSPVDEPEGGAPENHRTRRKPQPDIEVRKNGHWVLRK